VFAWCIPAIADYDSLFGALATVLARLTYLCLSTIALLTGVPLDAVVRRELNRP
jgi:uncharacterized BrkB/YihY/UPF0761 family membrane protein